MITKKKLTIKANQLQKANHFKRRVSLAISTAILVEIILFYLHEREREREKKMRTCFSKRTLELDNYCCHSIN